MMTDLARMAGRKSGRHNPDGTKRCKGCDNSFPVEVYKQAGPVHRESPYCPECEKGKRAEADAKRKARRERFPY